MGLLKQTKELLGIALDEQRFLKASPDAFYPPNKEALKLKKQYQKEAGLSTAKSPRIKELNVERSKAIADEFDKMVHAPNDPEVKAAYNQLAKEVNDQYQMLLDDGVKFEYYRGKGEPYKSSKEMAKDLKENKRLKVLATEGNFGQGDITPEELAENPMLQSTEFIDENGKKLLVNDVFRAVHDYFGHGSTGTGFGAIGEEGAWDAHAKMLSPLARRALTTETRGQNSWVNFGRQLRRPDGTIPQKGDVDYVPPGKREFAEQKIGLLPEEFSQSDYNTLINNPRFRELMKKGGFTAATAALLSNPNESDAAVYQVVRKIADTSFDPRFLKNYVKPRAGETEAMMDMRLGLSEDRIGDIPEVSITDLEGKPFIASMSDRTHAGQTLEGINDVKFDEPIDLQGGHDHMIDPRSEELWAAEGKVLENKKGSGFYQRAQGLGEDPLLMTFNMAPSGADQTTQLLESMLKYSSQKMEPSDIASLNDEIRAVFPDFLGVENPESVAQIKSLSGEARKQIVPKIDKYRDKGALSIGQARLAVTDPKQLNVREGDIRAVGEIDTAGGVYSSSHDTYQAGFGGEGLGHLKESGITPFDLLDPEVVKRVRPDIDLDNLTASDIRALTMNHEIQQGMITEDTLRRLEAAGRLDDSPVDADVIEPVYQAIQDSIKYQGGNIDPKVLTGLGLSSATAATVAAIVAPSTAEAGKIDAVEKLMKAVVKGDVKGRFPDPRNDKEALMYDALRVQKQKYAEPVFDRVEGAEGVDGAELRLPQEYKEQLNEIGVATPDIIELNKNDANVKKFVNSINKAKSENEYGAAVNVYPEEKYKDMQLFLTKDGKAGYALTDEGDLVSAFSDGTHKGVAPHLLMSGIEQGAVKLDAFDTILPDLYSRMGFREGGRLRWDDKEAPADWDKVLFSEYNAGEPDISYMGYSSKPATPLEKAPYSKDYDDAVAGQERMIDKNLLADVGTGAALGVAYASDKQGNPLGTANPDDNQFVPLSESIQHHKDIVSGGLTQEEDDRLTQERRQRSYDRHKKFLSRRAVRQAAKNANQSVDQYLADKPSLKAFTIGMGKGFKDISNIGVEAYYNLTGDDKALQELEERKQLEETLFNEFEGVSEGEKASIIKQREEFYREHPELEKFASKSIVETNPLAALGGEMAGELAATLPAGYLGSAMASKLVASPAKYASRIDDYARAIGGGAGQGALWGAADDSAVSGAVGEGIVGGVGEYVVPKYITRPAKALWANRGKLVP
jgi:hypothetical protein